jgi:hypothetical protein
MASSPFPSYPSRRSLCASAKAAFPIFFSFLLLLGAVQTAAIAKGDGPSYAEKGKVVAVRVDERTDYVPISPPDSKGRTQGGEAFVHRRHVYRVETEENIYDLEGNKDPTLRVGDAVEFRIEGETAHVRVGEKEKKYRIITTHSKPVPKQ